MSNAEYAGFIYARMTSKRFPKKPFETLAGHKLIEWVINRSRKSRLDKLVLLTTADSSDDVLADYSSNCGLMVFRGDSENLVKRTTDALNEMDFAGFFRLNGDSPLVDSDLLNLGIEQIRRGSDFVTNLEHRTQPYGVSVEGVSTEKYIELANRAHKSELEHVSSHLYRHLREMKFASITNGNPDGGLIRATIDTPRDLSSMRTMVSLFEHPMYVSYWNILGLEEPKYDVDLSSNC